MIVVNRGHGELQLWEVTDVRVKKRVEGSSESFFVRVFLAGSIADASHFDLNPKGLEVVDIIGSNGKKLVTVTEKRAKWRMQ